MSFTSVGKTVSKSFRLVGIFVTKYEYRLLPMDISWSSKGLWSAESSESLTRALMTRLLGIHKIRGYLFKVQDLQKKSDIKRDFKLWLGKCSNIERYLHIGRSGPATNRRERNVKASHFIAITIIVKTLPLSSLKLP